MDQLFDLYWGGPERRITGLTLRIIAVNAVALIILAVGILYLGQYQNNIIEAKLETFRTEVALVSAALSEGAIEETTNIYSGKNSKPKLDIEEVKKMARKMGHTMNRRVYVFDEKGDMIVDSNILTSSTGTIQIIDLPPRKDTLYSIEILRGIASFILHLLPDKKILPKYPVTNKANTDVSAFPDAHMATKGAISFSAWLSESDRIFLSSAAPLMHNGQNIGVVLLTRLGEDIEDAVLQVWFDILRIFLGTLIITILLSIYLSGAIANPLRKLMNAAKSVRSGKSRETEIPDLSYRRDEIGELSLVLREMTDALWERMDTIERFAADVSHELKNPLTSLKSAIETLAIVKKKADHEKLLEIVAHDIERLDRLITDISHASRLDASLSRETFSTINIAHILNEILDRYKNPLERDSKGAPADHSAVQIDGITLSLNIVPHQNFEVVGSKVRLLQVFENLVSNALSFSKKTDSIEINVSNKMNYVIITITDHGPGIPASKLETVFERFYSERPQHEDYGRHSGLGLSICKQIIHAHGGRIFAENIKEPDGTIQGAQFTVILNTIRS